MDAEAQLTQVFSALADPTRRGILAQLAQGPARVGDVASRFEVSAPAISQHLKVLERAGLVARAVNAQWRTLTLQPEPLEQASAWVEQQRREWSLRLDSLEKHLETMKQATTTQEEPA